MGCGDFIISTILRSLRYGGMLWVHKALSSREAYNYTYLIDGVCFGAIFVDPNATVSRHDRTRYFITFTLNNVYQRHGDGNTKRR